MAVFKCKMCGGTIEFAPGESVGICDSCGTKQTLPRLDSDKKAQLYDRADHFRRNNEFDKAMGIYEQILNEDEDDAEAYWSLVLCKYGIEYVEDPATHRRIPTVNRAQYTSIFDDEDYKAALRHADGHQREIYEQEAGTINEIQKGILAISAKEEPFDVFICYKETDANGRRTPDSVLANDLYHQLTQEGFKVFFARITLEDKLGSAYEPYIFAALNSAKVMVVLGTRPAYFQAAWVKNEWSRYLALVKESGGKKILIPAYKDMDPYDLPEEFSHLQAQDMSKLGFMQDLIRGIRKIMAFDAPQAAARENVVVKSESGSVQAFLDRGFMALEDGEWSKADEFFERALDFDAKLAEAYLGKLMAQLQVSRREQLADAAEPFDEQSDYQKAVRFGDETLKTEMRGYIAHIYERNKTYIYNNAKDAMNAADTENEFKSAANMFAAISGFKDADALVVQCCDRAEICRKDAIYSSAKSEMSGKSIARYEAAIKAFKTISDWKDSDEQINACQAGIEEIKAREEAKRLGTLRRTKRYKKIVVIILLIIAAYIIVYELIIYAYNAVVVPNGKYNDAIALMNAGKYDEAITAFDALNGYRNSENQIENCYIGKYGEEKWNIVKNINVGDTYIFGAYEQDNNVSNGKEAIEWTVLDKKGMSLLLISKYALDRQQYNSLNDDVTWENCTLRKWLNSTFFNDAFNAEEQAKIRKTTVLADKNPKYSTDPGNDTNDMVFLLSINEAEKYFSSASVRVCKPTKYTVANGAYVDGAKGNCLWWLRSPGFDYYHSAAVINSDGSFNYSGNGVINRDNCVRPVLWIDLYS